MKKRLDAYRIFLIFQGGSAFFYRLVFTVNMFFYVDKVELNALQLILVGTALEGAVFLCEIPTGIVADVYSRRLSVIIGTLITGIGFLLSAIPVFGIILIGQATWGVGYTFISGAIQAWITDEIGEEAANRAFLRVAQIDQGFTIVGLLVSVGLAFISIYVPLAAGGAGFILIGVFLMLFMPEDGFKPTPESERSSWGAMWSTVREAHGMVRRRPILLNILAVSLIFGAFSEGFDRLWTAHLLDRFTLPDIASLPEVAWFGFISLSITVIAIPTTEIVRRRVNTGDPAAVVRAMRIITIFIFTGVLTFALAQRLSLALVMLVIAHLMRRLIGPLQHVWLNQGLDSRVRATIFSAVGQMDAFGQIALGPVLGLIALETSMPTVLVISALMLLPVLRIYGLTLSMGEKAAASQAAAS